MNQCVTEWNDRTRCKKIMLHNVVKINKVFDHLLVCMCGVYGVCVSV